LFCAVIFIQQVPEDYTELIDTIIVATRVTYCVET
jgi:hypothetical protein